MYLKTVVEDIQRSKNIKSEDLFKLNEAVFNLLESETVDSNMAAQIYTCTRKCVEKGKKRGQVDDNYLYDLRAMLGTLQNQHFFTMKQNTTINNWLSECFEGGTAQPEKGGNENERLKKRVAELEKLLGAVRTVLSFGASGKESAKDMPKGKSKKGDSKGRQDTKSPGKGDKKQQNDESQSRGRRRRGRGGKQGGGGGGGGGGQASEKWKPKAN